MSFSPGPFSVSRRGSIPVDDTLCYLVIPLCSQIVHQPPCRKQNECRLPHQPCWIKIAATGAHEMRKMEKQSCSLTHPARH